MKFVNLQNAEFLVMNTSENQNAIFPRGERAPADYFTGKVWVKPLVPDDQVFNCVIGNVIFEPGARNNWHKHPGGQILIVTHGIGYYQKRANPFSYFIKEMLSKFHRIQYIGMVLHLIVSLLILQ